MKRIRKAAHIQRIPIRENGIVGVLFVPESDHRLPVIVTLTGSNGGMGENRAQMLANHGFATLGLGYFGVEGLPDRLENIPLEYFEKAFQWIETNPKLDPSRIGIFGVSRGGELSLLLGTVFPEKMRAICAITPSSVINGGLAEKPCEAWVLHGIPIAPFAPVAQLCLQGEDGKDPAHAVATAPLFLEGMNDKAAFEKSAIRVEKIRCPVMIICGGDDQMWPAFVFAEQINQRLKKSGSAVSFELLKYPNAGHGISIPYTPALGPEYFHPFGKLWFTLGGSAQEDDLASRDAWEKLIFFFEQNL